eukprot:TRINITY_DN10624_c0_g1_i1.p2 TRINITY_DN10624_c0_g1~~TRINITY_DN10624_c0_g1_i1.p2  ORF type:complete len:244 (-),score=12.75 TRINITY_DN10624_c0_g1_i1:133-864(-)
MLSTGMNLAQCLQTRTAYVLLPKQGQTRGYQKRSKLLKRVTRIGENSKSSLPLVVTASDSANLYHTTYQTDPQSKQKQDIEKRGVRSQQGNGLGNGSYELNSVEGEQGEEKIEHTRSMKKSEKRMLECQQSGDKCIITETRDVVGREHLLHQGFWKFAYWFHNTWLNQASEGLEHLPLERGAFIIASNHQSHLDASAVFIAAYLGGVKKMFALGARDYFFQNPFKGTWIPTPLITTMVCRNTL